MKESMPSQEREGVSIIDAWKEMPRSHQAMVALILLCILSAAGAHLISWGRHKAFLNVGLIAFAMVSMLIICVWHAVAVKGVKAAVAFFVLCVAVSWTCEFLGHNWGLFFGDYKYTGTLGPAIGGVPVIISITWSMVIYSSFMLVDWLVGIGGHVPSRTWWGRGLWSTLVAAAGATLVCAWDLVVDPVATSGIWWTQAGKNPWWYWIGGGPYLKELPGKEGLGAPGVPIGNFAGWWLALFFVILVFMLFFQRENRVHGNPVELVPFLVYLSISFFIIFVALEMNWHFDGMNQVALIGTFTTMPVILVSAVKIAWDYPRGHPGTHA